MNDRALRKVVLSLGGVANGFPREDGFDIVPASEIMAILCLAEDLEDLRRRLSKIVVGYTHEYKPVTTADLEATGALMALLRYAFSPNVVQTIEHNPALIHGGPFANIAHGCSSVVATKTALKLANYVVTEAGFGADLGGEKFMDIKCRKAGLQPDCTVVVATVRALKLHGGVPKDALREESVSGLERGFCNLIRHVENIRKFGVPVVVAVNRFAADTEAEIAAVLELCESLNVECVTADHWAKGGEGAEGLAELVVRTTQTKPTRFRTLYSDDMPLWTKAQTVAREMYGADDIIADQKVRNCFRGFEEQGYGLLPVCIAKTEFSFTTDPDKKGAPKHHVVPIRDVRLAAGAEFVTVICGEIMTMPGLPRRPAAGGIDLTADGRITGLD
jgi:formate--tetrahydrofolate ligase